MNYRHGYHAGNFADVLKHTALCELLRLLTAKDKKLFVLDTHAGAGGYALGEGPARRTGEAEAGIGRLVASPRAGMPARRRALSGGGRSLRPQVRSRRRRAQALSGLAAAGPRRRCGRAIGSSPASFIRRRRWRSSASSRATVRSRCARPTATRS